MEAIKIDVNKQMDGYSFSITPSIRKLIKSLFPDAHPANGIFVAYDTRSDFKHDTGKLETYIYPALLGVDDQKELTKKIGEILFVDTQTGHTIIALKP